MIIDVTQDSFHDEVLARSRELPVIVDFWAEWCGPCRQLGPALEAAVTKREGAVVLAKVDSDANSMLARMYTVQSIPAVKAFVDEEIAWEFVGLKAPKEIDELIDKLLPSEADRLVEAGDEASLRRALELEPGRADASFMLARILYDRDDLDAALALLVNVPGSFVADGLRARIEIEQAGEPDLTDAFFALDRGMLDRGLDVLLEELPNAGERRDAVRRLYVGVLDDLDPADPTVRLYRRRLAEALA